MKKSYLTFAVIGLIVLIAALTNPDQAKHKEVIKNKLHAYMQGNMRQSSAETNNVWEQAGEALGMMLGGALVDRIIDNLVSVDNYVLFSTTNIRWQGQTKIIGIGAFGNVYLTGKLDEATNQGLLKSR